MQEVSFLTEVFAGECQPEWYMALFPASLADTQGTIFKSLCAFLW